MNEFLDYAWRAKVDGVKSQSLRVNRNQIGVPFTSGTHLIEIRCLPINFLMF